MCNSSGVAGVPLMRRRWPHVAVREDAVKHWNITLNFLALIPS